MTAFSRFGRRGLVLLLALCVVLISLLFAVPPKRASAEAINVVSPSTKFSPLEANNIANAVDAQASADYSNVYGGLVVDMRHAEITVYVTAPLAKLESRLRDIARPAHLVFAPTLHTLAYLTSVHQRVTSDYTRLAVHGIHLAEWWPNITSGKEAIGVENLTNAAVTLLAKTFGLSDVTVFDVAPDKMPILTASKTNRAFDLPPWNGGDFISDLSEGCTSAFGITINGALRLLTAAHCFPKGDAVYNQGGTGASSGALIGTVKALQTTSGSTDSEIIAATSGKQVWTGPVGDATATDITGSTTNSDGTYVCNDGAYSGEVCNLQITANNECISPTGFRYECHIVHAEAYDRPFIANQAGDSGGPILLGADAVGVDSASTSNDTVPCQYNTPDTCYGDVYYSAIDSILSEWGAALNKS